MSDIELKSRPAALFKVVERALGHSKTSNLLRLEFCVYKPHERHERAHQIIIQVPALELRNEFSRLLNELRSGYEIGLTSRVTLLGNPDVMMHLPMIDFKGMDIAAIPEIEKAILAEVPTIRGLSWFSSGRSLHAYGHSLVNQTSWMLLMGGAAAHRW